MTTTTVLKVDGMTCSHCVNAVTKELTSLAGVSDVTVDLKPEQTSTVTVTSAAPLIADEVSAAIDEAGYDLAGPTQASTSAPDLIPLVSADTEPAAAGGCGCGGCGCK